VSEKKEPRNAVIVMHAVAAVLLLTILPSPVAFTSLVSAAGVPTITAYALISCVSTLLPTRLVLTFPVGRCFLTPTRFKNAKWSLGRFSRPMNFVSFIWNTYSAAILFSPLQFPVTGDTFNCRHPRMVASSY
jgi:hypothetical protein